MKKLNRPLIILILGAFFFNAGFAEAKNVTTRKAIIVGKAALYGLGGGLVIGLASQVVKKRTKNIFVAGSLGMYAGIATGLYLIFSAGSGVKEYEGPDTYEDFSGWDSYIPHDTTNGLQVVDLERDSLLHLNLLEASF
jgi:hypothetical protein